MGTARRPRHRRDPAASCQGPPPARRRTRPAGVSTCSASTVQAAWASTARGSARWRSTVRRPAPPRGRRPPASPSARVTIGTRRSRSAISSVKPLAARSRSTAIPSRAGAGEQDRELGVVEASPPNVAESGATTPGTSRRTPRARRTRSSRAPASASPRTAISACTASTLARIAPDGEVVAVASMARSSRSGASRSVRASTTAPWFRAGKVLCALVTTASAPAANGCGGRSGWLPRWAPHAASTSSGTPAARVTSAQGTDVRAGPDVRRAGDEHGPGVRMRPRARRRRCPPRLPGEVRSPGRAADAPTPAAARRGPARAGATGARCGPRRPCRPATHGEGERLVAVRRAADGVPAPVGSPPLCGPLLGLPYQRIGVADGASPPYSGRSPATRSPTGRVVLVPRGRERPQLARIEPPLRLDPGPQQGRVVQLVGPRRDAPTSRSGHGPDASTTESADLRGLGRGPRRRRVARASSR